MTNEEKHFLLIEEMNKKQFERERVNAQLDDYITSTLKINRTDFRIMDILLDGPSTPTELRKKILLTPSAMTAALDRLEALGYIKRMADPKDRRKTTIVPTDKYKAVNAIIFDPLDSVMRDLFNEMTDEEIHGAIKYLDICIKQYPIFRNHLKTQKATEIKSFKSK